MGGGGGRPRPRRGNLSRGRAWNTPGFGSGLSRCVGQPAPFNKPQALLAAPSGPGLAALDLAWKILLSKEPPL